MKTNSILKALDNIMIAVVTSYLVFLLLLVSVLLFASCENNLDISSREMEVKYDSEDNIVKIDGQWMQSIDLDTWEPENEYFGIWHDANFLFIKSNTYQIISVEVVSLASYTTITDNTAHVYIPDMKNYLNGNDVFNLKIEVSLPYN